MTVSLLVVFASVGVAALLWRTEQSGSRFAFALTAVAVLTTILLLATGDLERAVILSALLALAVVGLSKVKFHHSARAMIVADAPLLFAGTVPFFFTQYRRMMSMVVGGGVLLCVASALALAEMAGSQLSLSVRLLALAVAISACSVMYRLNGGLVSFRRSVTEPSGFFSTFAASLFDVRSWWRTRSLNPPGIAQHALPLSPPVSGNATVDPHIILIQHESVFDPRVFGLPVSPDVAAFLTPGDGASGEVDVEIFGGGSWQSEFSVMTGIPSGLFGTDAYFLFQRGVGRFHHTLPGELKRCGYRTSLISSCRRSFLNYDAFYGGVGMDRLVFSDDLPQPFDVAAFDQTFSDGQFLPAAMRQALDFIEGGREPQFVYMLTNFNHGPHNRRLASSASETQRAFAMDAIGDAEYAEYFARLADTARTWAAQRQRLVDSAVKRPILVLHYGDHQPVLTRRIEERRGEQARAERTFRTFFAIEAFGMPVPQQFPLRLPIAYLAPALLRAAGLSLDGVNATRVALLESDGAERTQGEGRLLRTLVDMKLVDLG